MIGKIKQKSGSSGGSINYIIGGKKDKHDGKVADKIVTVVDYNDFVLSASMKREIEFLPTTEKERKLHKQALWKISQKLAAVFDARVLLADERVKKPFEEYVLGYSPEDVSILSTELRREIVREFLKGMGIHGDIEVVRRKKGGKKEIVKVHRNAMYLACSHGESNAPHDHLFTCRIDADGKANDTKNERYRALKVCRELSRKYHLHLRLNGDEVTAENGYTICEKDYDPDRSKTNDGNNVRLDMKDAVFACIKESASWDELEEKLLNKYGIEVDILRHRANNNPYGVNFHQMYTSKRPVNEGYVILVTTKSGTQLCRGKLTFQKITQQLEANALALRKAAIAKRQPVPVAAPPPETKKEPTLAEIVFQRMQKCNLNIITNEMNRTFDGISGHFHYVPLEVVPTATGCRVVYGSDGYVSKGDAKIYYPHEASPLVYGQAYADFSINERNELVAVIEADPVNYYTKGLSGTCNYTLQKIAVEPRPYSGFQSEQGKKKTNKNNLGTTNSHKNKINNLKL